MKSKGNSYLRLFNILLVVAAYVYLGYKLATFDGYDALVTGFSRADGRGYMCLAVALTLMPVNLLCEAWKWRTLMRNVQPMTLSEALLQVCYGCIGAFVTPYRTGDYPTRALLLRNHTAWAAAVTLGVIGSAAMLMVEVGVGLPAAALFARYKTAVSAHSLLIAGATVIGLILVMIGVVSILARREWSSQRLQAIFAELRQFSIRRMAEVTGISLVRYVVWGVQLALVLYFCQVQLSPMQLAIAIPSYYLLIGLLPSLPLADIAIRGSVSIVVFGTFSDNSAGIALAAVVVWTMNTMLPMLIGTFLQKQYNRLSIN